MNTYYLLLIIVIFFITKYLYEYYIHYTYSENVISTIDNKKYLVRNTKNKILAANTLAHLNSNIKKLIDYLVKNKDKYKIFEKNISLLSERYKNFELTENILLSSTAYTINKKETVVCLTTRDSHEKIYDINTLMFVVLHELSHIACETYGHNEEFVNFFVFVLYKSIELGLYKKVDYKKNPQEYCGIMIDSTPI